MSNTIKNVDANGLAAELAEPGTVVVDLWAPWCGPCGALGRELDKIAARQDGEGVRIIKVNTDENTDVGQQLGVMGLPTVVVFKDGAEINRLSGGVNSRQVEAAIAAAA
jgi:thioredoxin